MSSAQRKQLAHEAEVKHLTNAKVCVALLCFALLFALRELPGAAWLAGISFIKFISFTVQYIAQFLKLTFRVK